MFRDNNNAERRQSLRRLAINPQVAVSVGESRTDLLYDLSEGGLSVYGLLSKRRDQLFPVAFDLPGGSGSITASAEIAWVSPTKNRTGLRFLSVAGASQQRLADWMAAPRYDSRRKAAARPAADRMPFPDATPFGVPAAVHRVSSGVAAWPTSLPKVHQPVAEIALPIFSQENAGGSSGDRKPWRMGGIVVVAALLALGLGFFIRRAPKIMHTGTVTETTSMTVSAPAGETSSLAPPVASPVAPSSTVTRSATPTTTSASFPATTTLDAPGFVLQVGAMRNESNADALSDSLKGQSFPAFVFRLQRDGIYRVAVGPYADRLSATRAKKKLQSKNVASILRPWSPDQR